MKIVVEFDVDNATFHDGWHDEVDHVLSQAKRILRELEGPPGNEERFEVLGRLRDVNGNRVGSVVCQKQEI